MQGSPPSSNSLSSASVVGKPSCVSHIGAPTHPLSNPTFTHSSNVISVIFLLPMARRFRLPLCIYLIPVIRKPSARLAVLPCTPSAWKKWAPRQAVFSLAVCLPLFPFTLAVSLSHPHPFEMCSIRACRLMFLFRPGFASRLFTGVQGELYSK